MLARLVNRLHKNERGMTRPRPAIILIAVAVVAVFSLGMLFFPQESEVTVYSGPGKNNTLQLRGAVLARGTPNNTALDCSDGCITEIIFTVALAEDGEPVNFTTTRDSNGNGILGDETMPRHTVVISYIDDHQRVDDLTWRFVEYGPGDGDNLLEAGENFRIAVGADNNGHTNLLDDALNPNLGASTDFAIEVKTPNGEVLAIQRTTPDCLDTVMNLY